MHRLVRRLSLPFAMLICVMFVPGASAQHVERPFAGVNGTISHAATIPLTVGSGSCVCGEECIFRVAASSSTVILPRGGTVIDAINISCLLPGGFVSLSLSGIPVGVIASFEDSVTSGSAALSLSATNAAPLGPATITLVASSGFSTVTFQIVVIITDVNMVGDASCHIAYDIVSEWDGMFEAVLSIDNATTVPIQPGWTLTWAFADGQTVSQLWNGTVMQTAANVVVRGDVTIPASGSDKGVGFLGTRMPNVPNQVPTTFLLNGIPCKIN